MPNKKTSKTTTKKSRTKTATKYNKHKKNITTLSKTQPLNTLKFEENYFDIMHNRWLIDKYIAKNGIYTDENLENTMPAFEAAIKAKCPITITVQALLDGTPICYKDRTLARAQGNGYVANVNYADIKDLVINGTEEHICTLSQVLDKIDGKIPVVIDILSDAPTHKAEESVLAIVDEYMQKHNINEGVAIMSINPYVLEWFMSSAPWLPRILRSGKFKVKKYGTVKGRHLRKLKLHTITGCDYVAYNAKDLPYGGIKKVNPVGVIAYNVQNQEQYQKIAKWCDNIIYEGFEPHI